MFKKRKHSTSPAFLVYASACSLILSWWYLAFFTTIFQKPVHQEITKKPINIPNTPKAAPFFTKIDREQLHQALAGDYALMAALIRQWDLDAEILEFHHIEKIKRLNRSDFVHSQIAAKQLTESSKTDLKNANNFIRPTSLTDDLGKKIDLQHPFGRFLPQTYVSASFLLAMLETEQIAALPNGLRRDQCLYPLARTEKIPLDIDRYNSEKIFLSKPDVAFVADYSHPSTIQALQDQGIQLFTINSINTPQQIQTALLKIGKVVNRVLESEMLSIFIDAAFLAIDNQLITILADSPAPPRILYVSYQSQLKQPTPLTLTWHLLEKIGISQRFWERKSGDSINYTTPLATEQILHNKPDGVIISSCLSQADQQTLLNKLILKEIPSFCASRICFVDDNIQQTPTQYMVLAYFDLADAITQINSIQSSSIEKIVRVP